MYKLIKLRWYDHVFNRRKALSMLRDKRFWHLPWGGEGVCITNKIKFSFKFLWKKILQCYPGILITWYSDQYAFRISVILYIIFILNKKTLTSSPFNQWHSKNKIWPVTVITDPSYRHAIETRLELIPALLISCK